MAARAKAVQTEPNLNVEQWPIDRVIGYARNPRKISDAAVSKVAASIKEYGFRQPIVVDKEGVIIVGHTRLAASQKLGLETVPVHVAADMTPQQAKAYRLTDNRTAEENDWATDLLALELTDLQEDGFDLDILGFDQSEIDALFGESDTPIESSHDAVVDAGDRFLLLLEFNGEEEQQTMFAEMQERGVECKIMN